jgi:glycosyltransferase involved in cell wall biosynthesis
MKQLSVVIPCYNDPQGLPPTVAAIEKSLREQGIAYEIIIVDDGSNPPIEQTNASENVCWFRHEMNRGYGASLKTGIRRTHSETILIIDSDGTYPAEKAGELFQRYRSSGVDMLIGTRQGADARIPLARRPAKWLLNRFAALLVGQPVPDLNSGMRIFRKDLFRRYETLFPSGFSFTSTLTLASLADGFQVLFEPIEYRGRIGSSSIRPIRDTYNFFLLVLTSTLYFNPLRILLPVAIVLFLLATATLFFTKYALGQIADITVTVLYMLAFQVGLLGFIADVIVRRSRSSPR